MLFSYQCWLNPLLIDVPFCLGDKPETAVNIAYASGLFSPSMKLLDLQAKSKSVAETIIHNHLETIQRESILNQEQPEYNHVTTNSNDLLIDFGPNVSRNELLNHQDDNSKKQRSLIVDGKTLTFILDPKSGLTGPFLELTRNCNSVLACRATPLQKVSIYYKFCKIYILFIPYLYGCLFGILFVGLHSESCERKIEDENIGNRRRSKWCEHDPNGWRGCRGSRTRRYPSSYGIRFCHRKVSHARSAVTTPWPLVLRPTLQNDFVFFLQERHFCLPNVSVPGIVDSS